MAKSSPEERWYAEVLRRVKAFELSEELEPLRQRGLAVLGRKKPYADGGEWWQDARRRGPAMPGYMEWHQECEALALRFGLAPWVAVLVCLLKGYKPEDDIGMMVMEARWPSIRIVTEATDPLFVTRLMHEAKQLGLYVVQKQGPSEATLIPVDTEPVESESSPLASRPPVDAAFYVRVETPPGYPPEAASRLHKQATWASRELQKRLGYPTKQRLRASPLTSKTDELRMGKRPLTLGESYDIIDETYEDDDMGKDQERREQIKSRRHKLKMKLIEPYRSNES